MNGNGPFDPRKEAPLLSAYVDGELDPENVARIEAHLALPDNENAVARREIDKLRRLNQMTGAMRLKEPPAEEWETFWASVYNRAERSLGWILMSIGLVVIGAWASLQVITSLLADKSMPLYLKGSIFIIASGVLVLLISVIRERIYKRRHTRYKDVIR